MVGQKGTAGVRGSRYAAFNARALSLIHLIEQRVLRGPSSDLNA